MINYVYRLGHWLVIVYQILNMKPWNDRTFVQGFQILSRLGCRYMLVNVVHVHNVHDKLYKQRSVQESQENVG